MTAEYQLTNSEMQAWSKCRRNWWLSYYLCYGPDPARALPYGSAPLGTRLHLACEANWGYSLNGLAVLDFLYKDAVHARPDCEEELGKERDLAMIMFEGLLEWTASEGFDMGYEVLSTEQEVSVRVPLPGGRELTLLARLDQVVRRLEDGALRFRDWKSVGNFSKANGLPRDPQMRLYTLIQALRAKQDPAQPRVDGGQYVMLLRSKRTARARGPFYGVADFAYNNSDLNSTWLRVRAIGSEILQARVRLDAGADPRVIAYTSPGDHCEWACPFRDICPMFDDGSRAEDALRGNFAQLNPLARYEELKIRDVLRVFRPQPEEQE